MELQKGPTAEFQGLGCLIIITSNVLDDDGDQNNDNEDDPMMMIMRIQLLFKPFGIWDLMSSRMSLMYWSILSSSTASL